MLNKTINGYTIKRKLGEGGMAEVWYAENEIGKPAAIKVLKTKFCADETIVERFQNEAKVMVKLSHPYIRQVYDYALLDGQPCIVMEYLEGDDLKARLKKSERFDDKRLHMWWNQLVKALNYTHQQGVIHRDIKPSNIFIDKLDNVRLMDFGIAKIEEYGGHTQTGVAMGTRIYMSPEQVRDPKRVTASTDAYSLAVTFVHLLTGKVPYDSTSSSDFDIQMAIVQQPLDLSALPNEWSGFLQPYLDKSPDTRAKLKTFDTLGASASKIQSASQGDETMLESSEAAMQGLSSLQDRIKAKESVIVKRNEQINQLQSSLLSLESKLKSSKDSENSVSRELKETKLSLEKAQEKISSLNIIYIMIIIALTIATISLAVSKREFNNKISELSYQIDNLRLKNNSLEDKNDNLSNMLEKVSKSNPIVVSSVDVKNDGEEYGTTIYSRNTTYLNPRIKGFSLIDGIVQVQVRLYTPYGLSRGTSSPSGCSYQSDLYLTKNESFDIELIGWGGEKKGHWDPGKYRYEIWYQGKCIASKSFTIH